MKKSKIIIPALGMLLLSTAASVSGTVAWFTSMQTGSANVTSFAVTKTGGSLGVAVSAGVGTETTGTSPYSGIALKGYSTSSDATDDVKLTHGSFDHTALNVYKPNDALDVFTPVAEPTTGNGYQWTLDGTDQTAGKIYYAVSWTITFTYTYSSDTRNVYLYFDGSVYNESTNPEASTFSHQVVTAGSEAKHTYMGFRIAMVGGAHKVVWAPGTNVDTDEKYQSGSAKANVSSYAATNAYNSAGNLIDSTGVSSIRSGTLPNNPTERADYIGTFTNTTPGTTNVIALKCVAWFEGNDTNVVDGADLDQVTAKLAFYTRIAA